ncbi:hypothetical protein BST34_07510 [Mycolicibacterium monacense DSM 44395]|nr:hypothetical protein [Mycolicibacterium monacense DSM 44395]OBF48757.1 hypothetical protein A5778_22275 [Mycolicibacterium monacense]ORB22480.1 hypothetical protein BST34_07510 [Mycolicibacterium monacense DSM 44395]
MTATALSWALIGLGIVSTTVWGNVEFCRRRGRARTEHVVRQDMAGFSPTIHEVDARPLVEPGRLRMSRRTS